MRSFSIGDFERDSLHSRPTGICHNVKYDSVSLLSQTFTVFSTPTILLILSFIDKTPSMDMRAGKPSRKVCYLAPISCIVDALL